MPLTFQASAALPSGSIDPESVAGVQAYLATYFRAVGSHELAREPEALEFSVPDQLLGDVPIGLRSFHRVRLAVLKDGGQSRLVVRATYRLWAIAWILALAAASVVVLPFSNSWFRAGGAAAIGFSLLAADRLHLVWFVRRLTRAMGQAIEQTRSDDTATPVIPSSTQFGGGRAT